MSNADPFPQSEKSENQDKTTDIYFGIFFDVREPDDDIWINKAGNYRKKGEKWKEGAESDLQESKAYKVGMLVEGIANQIVETLPDNPVSKVIKTALDTKDKIVGYKDKVEGAVESVTGFVDEKSDMIMNQDYVTLSGFDVTGSKRSIISKMEPAYYGKFVDRKGMDEILATYNFRVETTGSLFAQDFNPDKSDDEDSSESQGISEEVRQFFSEEAAAQVMEEIEKKVCTLSGTKLSLHFDLFGYAKDASMSYLESKINGLKQTFPNINEMSIDYKGEYENFNDPDEVQRDLGETVMRFKNTKFLEKNG